jgi:hypothetical protein
VTNAVRFVVTVPAAAVLVWCAAIATQQGRTDDILDDAGKEMGTWLASRSQPGEQTMGWVQEDLERAVKLQPSDPKSQELLGALKARRIERQEFLSESVVHFTNSLATRPTSPYTWANLAEVNYRMGKTTQEFENALRRASALGPAEPEVQRTVANLGLAVWNEVQPSTRAAIDRMVTEGIKRNPLEMLQIGERRGRLDVVCGHLKGAMRRPDSKWAQLCPSTEAIS